jgi:hypothetical protein
MGSRHLPTLLFALVFQPLALAQTPTLANQAAQQSARQALLEMVLTRYPAPFFAHLPEAAKKLAKADVTILPLQEISQAVDSLQWPGRTLETFDTGPILLRSKDSYSHKLMEVSVESESDGLDEDQLQLSLHVYREGKPHPLAFIPTAAVTMKLENDVWRLDDIAVSLRLPLGDQEFLDSLTPDRRPSEVAELEATALNHLRTLNTVEGSYAALSPEHGFACTLAELGGHDEPNPSAAGLIDSELASGRLDGYIFSIEVCSGTPVNAFSITAVPENRQTGLRAFCSDESGTIRFSEDGNGYTCLNEGEPVP